MPEGKDTGPNRVAGRPTEPEGAGLRAYPAPTIDQLLTLIEIHWSDLHHSRNQDWKYWVVIAAIAAGAANRSDTLATYVSVGLPLLAAGVGISLVATMVAWNHAELLLKKTSHIQHLEKLIAELRVREDGDAEPRWIPFYALKGRHRDRWFVSGILVSTYAAICIAFLITFVHGCRAAWLASDSASTAATGSGAALPSVLAGLVVAFAFFFTYWLGGGILRCKRQAVQESLALATPDARPKMWTLYTRTSAWLDHFSGG